MLRRIVQSHAWRLVPAWKRSIFAHALTSYKGVLNQIICIIPVSAQGHGKCTKVRDSSTKLVSGDGGSRHLVAPVRLYSETRQRSFRRTPAATGAASRDLAHDVFDLRRCWLVQHVFIAGLQVRSDARDTNGVRGWRGDGANVRLA